MMDAGARGRSQARGLEMVRQLSRRVDACRGIIEQAMRNGSPISPRDLHSIYYYADRLYLPSCELRDWAKNEGRAEHGGFEG